MTSSEKLTLHIAKHIAYIDKKRTKGLYTLLRFQQVMNKCLWKRSGAVANLRPCSIFVSLGKVKTVPNFSERLDKKTLMRALLKKQINFKHSVSFTCSIHEFTPAQSALSFCNTPLFSDVSWSCFRLSSNSISVLSFRLVIVGPQFKPLSPSFL